MQLIFACRRSSPIGSLTDPFAFIGLVDRNGLLFDRSRDVIGRFVRTVMADTAIR